MSITVITNAKVVHERGIIYGGAVSFENGRILSYGKESEIDIPADAGIIDALGAYVGPGFVDIHVHGGGGSHTSTDPRAAAAHFLKHGETSILATPSGITSKTPDQLVECIKLIRDAMPEARNIKGIFMEGPYSNGKYGAGKKNNIWGERPIVPEDYVPIVDAGGADIKNWMIAPERDGLIPFLEYARKVNPDVRFSVGHSEALPREIRALGKYKPTILTHTMNATGRVGEPKGGLRCVGPDEYAFRDPDMFCELISDSLGIHVDSELQQMLIEIKGINRVCLITDSTHHVESPPEQYAHTTDLNFNAYGNLAGSKLTMDKAAKNIMSHTRCGICEAFLMASTNPAKAVGIYDEVGSIDVGKSADLVFVDDEFNVKCVILNGEIQKI